MKVGYINYPNDGAGFPPIFSLSWQRTDPTYLSQTVAKLQQSPLYWRALLDFKGYCRYSSSHWKAMVFNSFPLAVEMTCFRHNGEWLAEQKSNGLNCRKFVNFVWLYPKWLECFA